MPGRIYLLLGAAALIAPAFAEAGEEREADAIVVLGHRPARDEAGVEYETRARVTRGVELLRQGRAPVIVFTGGETTEGVVEADVMAELAMSLGAPEGAVLRERRARDTIENARFSVELLRSHRSPAKPQLVLVTSDYHVARAARLFRCAGAEVTVESVALAIPARERFARRVREAAVRFYYWFFDECARARSE